MVITRVNKLSAKGTVYLVYIDGEPAFEVPEHELFKLGIYEGKAVEQKEIAWLKKQARISFARSEAIRYVSRSLRTVCEVRKKLQSNYDEEIIEEVISQLTQNRYLDDERYVEKYIAERKRLGNFSLKAVRYHLGEKGVAREITEEKLAESDYDEGVCARRLLEKRLRRSKIYERDRIKKYLYSKGFSMDTINQVLSGYEEGD